MTWNLNKKEKAMKLSAEEFKRILDEIDRDAWGKLKSELEKIGLTVADAIGEATMTTSDVIGLILTWDDTDDGYDYWRDTYHKVLDYIDNKAKPDGKPLEDKINNIAEDVEEGRWDETIRDYDDQLPDNPRLDFNSVVDKANEDLLTGCDDQTPHTETQEDVFKKLICMMDLSDVYLQSRILEVISLENVKDAE